MWSPQVPKCKFYISSTIFIKGIQWSLRYQKTIILLIAALQRLHIYGEQLHADIPGLKLGASLKHNDEEHKQWTDDSAIFSFFFLIYTIEQL